jgi:hypothetical protein
MVSEIYGTIIFLELAPNNQEKIQIFLKKWKVSFLKNNDFCR